MVFNQDFLSINKSCGIQLRLLRFFMEDNKIRWYSIMIFYNYKKSFDIEKYTNFDRVYQTL